MTKPKSEPTAGSIRVEPADPVRQARTRARQRLIGAFVLLLVGIIGFPLVFETEPRPIPVDIPIEIPQRDAVAPLSVPAARNELTTPARNSAVAASSEMAAVDGAAASRPSSTRPTTPAPTMIVESAEEAGRDVTAATPAASTSARSAARSSEAARRTADVALPTTLPMPATASSTPTRADDGARALALLEGRGASTAAAGSGRFVVQVGAFADNDAARETRRKVERLGLKTYVQVAQTTGGSRIRVRVGPYSSRAEADAALAKARAGGVDAVVLAL